jgi:hypothetical protein
MVRRFCAPDGLSKPNIAATVISDMIAASSLTGEFVAATSLLGQEMRLADLGFALPFLLAIGIDLWITSQTQKTTRLPLMNKQTKQNRNNNSNYTTQTAVLATAKTIWAVLTSFCGSYLLP